MRHLFAAVLALALPAMAVEQQLLCALGAGSAGYIPASDERPTSDAMQLIGQTFTAVKQLCGSMCPETVLYRNPTAPNLMLLVSNGRAKIVYAPAVFTAVYDKYGDPGIIGLLAHELGHELDDAMGAAWVEKNWTPEMRADGWAGCILAKAHLTQKEMTSALAAMADFPSPQHPAWDQRTSAIRSGYTHC